MQLRTELAATVLGFVALNLLLVFAAIGLFVRMGPAIERIILRNDTTIVAAEEILDVLARSPADPVPGPDRQRTARALARARNNITEEGEEPILASIAAHLDSALAGEREARTTLIDDLGRLVAINRAAIRKVDRDAQRLGRAGAWAAAFVGLASLAMSLFLTRSLGSRVVRPIRELRDVLRAARSGDRFRRCSVAGASPELRDALSDLNGLLDVETPVRSDEEMTGAVSVRGRG